MSEQQTYDVCIVPCPKWEEGQVTANELRLLSSFFSELLKELTAQLESEEE